MSTSKSLFASAKNDLVSGLIVFLIALPLCLGIAQASNAPLFSGIVAGVVGGIVIGFLSKSHLSVSGPAAGLVAIVIGAIEQLGAFEIFLCAVIVGGGVQLILGLVRAGTVANYFPTSVIEGMLAGIGLTIIFKQLPDAFGFLKDKSSVGMEDGEQGIATSGISHWLEHIEPGAIIIAVTGVLLLIIWSNKRMKKVQFLPAGLLVVILGVLINEALRASGSSLALHDAYLVQLHVPSNAGEFFGQFKMPDWKGFTNPAVWQIGVVIAVVASIETLLCIEATDKLDPYKRYTSGNAELRAQGIGNIVSGLIGGLPITSVIVRSSANINAGARTKLSTITHGVLLLVCVATIPFVLNMIPKAALAAILLFTGYRLCRPAVFKHMWHAGLPQFIPFVITAIAVALPMLGLLKGVGIGMVISIIFLLRNNMKIPYYYHRSKYSGNEVIKLDLAQEVSFLNKGSIKNTLDKLPENSIIILDATNTEYIDFDVLEVIKDFQKNQAVDKNIKMSLIGFKNSYKIPSPIDSSDIEEYLSDERPQTKTSGNHKKLLKQLEDEL